MRRILLSVFLASGCYRALPDPIVTVDAGTRADMVARRDMVECGGDGQPCCDDVTPPDCTHGLRCDPQVGLCGPQCGGVGQPCCAGACYGGLSCESRAPSMDKLCWTPVASPDMGDTDGGDAGK